MHVIYVYMYIYRCSIALVLDLCGTEICNGKHRYIYIYVYSITHGGSKCNVPNLFGYADWDDWNYARKEHICLYMHEHKNYVAYVFST